jgi:hypothetical protein
MEDEDEERSRRGEGLGDEEKAGRVVLGSVEEETHGALIGVDDVVEGELPLAVHQVQERLTTGR